MDFPSHRASPCPPRLPRGRPTCRAPRHAPAGRASFADPHLRCTWLRGEAFASGMHRGNASQRLARGLRHADDAGALLEIVDAKRRGEAGATRCGEHVIGARAVVADRLRAVAAEENGARVLDPGQPARRLGHAELEMLWRDAAGERAGFLYIARLDERATCLERRGDDALS